MKSARARIAPTRRRTMPLRPTTKFWLMWLAFSSTIIGIGGLIQSLWIMNAAYDWAFLHFPPYFWRITFITVGLLSILALSTRNLVFVRMALGLSIFVQLAFGWSIVLSMIVNEGGYLPAFFQWWAGAAIGAHLLSQSLRQPRIERSYRKPQGR